MRARVCVCVCVRAALRESFTSHPSPLQDPQPAQGTDSFHRIRFPTSLSSGDSRPGFGWSMDKRPFENSSLVINMGSEVEMG